MNIDSIKEICGSHLVSFNLIWMDFQKVDAATNTVFFYLADDTVVQVSAQSLEETGSDTDEIGAVYVMRDIHNVHHLVRFYRDEAIKVD